MGDDFTLKICCMGAGYVGGPTMAVIAKQCPKVRRRIHPICVSREESYEDYVCTYATVAESMFLSSQYQSVCSNERRILTHSSSS